MNELHEHRKSYINYLNKYISGDLQQRLCYFIVKSVSARITPPRTYL